MKLLKCSATHRFTRSGGAKHNHRGLKALATTIGIAVLALSTTKSQAADNTTTGAGALISITTGIGNTADGYQALGKDNSGSRNIAVGAYSLWSNTTGTDNTAGGYQALYGNLIGSFNTAIGGLTLVKNTGSYNTAGGYQSLYNNVSGAYNTAYGANTLVSNISSYNTAVGCNSLYSNTGGGFNTATGFQALYLNLGGSYNTANGAYALLRNQGANNTATGYSALYANTSGEHNVANGFQALSTNTTGGYNVAIGDGALLNNTTGSGNIAIGEDAGSNLTSGKNNITIGHKGVAGESGIIRIGTTWSTTEVDGQTDIYLAGIIHGDGSGLTKLTVPAASVTGQLSSTQIATGATGITDANIAPTAAISAAKIGSGQVVKSLNTLTDAVTLVGSTGITINTNSTSKTVTISATGTGSSAVTVDSFTLTGNGTASSPLSVNLSLEKMTSLGSAIFTAKNTSWGNGIAGISATGKGVYGQSGSGPGVYGYTTSSQLNSPAGPAVYGKSDGVAGPGVVGISTTASGVEGTSAGGIGVRGDSNTNWGVHGNSQSNWGVYGHSQSNAGVQGISEAGGDGVAGRTYAAGKSGVSGFTDVAGAYGVYGTNAAGGEAGHFEGKVKINGTASVKVLEITGGADLAEPFQITGDEIPKGSVVVIDENNPGHLKRSEHAYDQRVAGIVSGANGINPGIALHQDGVLEGGQNVALTGRVYVQASAANGPIKPGDMLTTSDIPCRAMKVSDHAKAQGAIIGKAMSSLQEGTGMVLVLVTLQ